MKQWMALLFLLPVLAWARNPELLQVSPGLYRGGRPTADDVLFLNSVGVHTVISLQGGDLQTPGLSGFIWWYEPGERPESIAAEKAMMTAAHLEFFNFPMNSLMPITAEEDAWIDQALDLMHSPQEQPVFVHCEHGKDRTGMLVALYRVKYEGWTPDDADAEWTALGHTPVARLFTGNLDRYFFAKTASLAAAKSAKPRVSLIANCRQALASAAVRAR